MSDFAQTSHKKDFIKFLCSRFFITVAINIQNVTLGWQIYQITNDPLDLGFIGLAQFIPMLLVSTFSGALVDRKNKYKLILMCQLMFFLSSLSFAFISIYAPKNVNAFYLILILIGTTRAFMSPAGQAFFPSLASKVDFPKYVAQSSMVWQLALIIGPSLGGILFAYFNRAEVLYFICAGLFLVLMLIFGSIQTRPQQAKPKKPQEQIFTELLEGIHFLYSEKRILGVTSLDLFAVLLGGATALLPVYAKDILSVGPQGLGYLRSAPGLGATLMALYLSRYPIQRNMGVKMFASVILFGVFTIGFAYSQHLTTALFFLFFMGASDIVSVVTRGTLIQILTPSHMRGRLSAINTVFISASNELGEFESGYTARLFGTISAVAIGGVGTVMVSLLWMRIFPSLKKLDKV